MDGSTYNYHQKKKSVKRDLIWCYNFENNVVMLLLEYKILPNDEQKDFGVCNGKSTVVCNEKVNFM